MNYTLVSDALLDRFDKENQAVREPLPHPISEDQSVLRPSLIPQLVERLGRNHARQVEEAGVYELGRVLNRGEGAVVLRAWARASRPHSPPGRGMPNKKKKSGSGDGYTPSRLGREGRPGDGSPCGSDPGTPRSGGGDGGFAR